MQNDIEIEIIVRSHINISRINNVIQIRHSDTEKILKNGERKKMKKCHDKRIFTGKFANYRRNKRGRRKNSKFFIKNNRDYNVMNTPVEMNQISLKQKMQQNNNTYENFTNQTIT